jgi:para-aminobenzoate synthetase/4-amino-4-deoxychorismate lyase
MTSTVEGKTEGGLVDIFGALFPAASITGAPKVRTMSIIKRLESTPRLLYSGAIGNLLPGRKALFNVAIRTVLVDSESGTAEYGTGGGIVWDSTVEAELAETKTKARLLSEPTGEFSLLETLLWTPAEGYVLLNLHLERLVDSALYFAIKVDPDGVRKALLKHVPTLNNRPSRVRLLVSEEGTISVSSEPWPETLHEKRPLVRLSRTRVSSSDRFLYHKTTNRRVYEEARRSVHDCDDVLLRNEHDELTESTIANLVLELDGQLVTPPVRCGLLPGIYRQWMLRGGTVQECVVSVEDLKRATRVFLVNSVRGQYEITLAQSPDG